MINFFTSRKHNPVQDSRRALAIANGKMATIRNPKRPFTIANDKRVVRALANIIKKDNAISTRKENELRAIFFEYAPICTISEDSNVFCDWVNITWKELVDLVDYMQINFNPHKATIEERNLYSAVQLARHG